MKKLNAVLAAVVLILVLGVSVQSTMSYFTDRTTAEGGYTISLGDKTQIEEKFGNWTKKLTITNDEEAQPIYVRAKAFAGGDYTLNYAGEGWTQGEDGYYYYANPVAAGESAAELDVQIGNIPEKVIDGKQFNVVVVYESTPVLYDKAGEPFADWTMILDNGTATEEEGEITE